MVTNSDQNEKLIHVVPFWISSDYFVHVLGRNADNIDRFWELQKDNPSINRFHSDLHIFPYTHAIPAILSLGCKRKCSFCPTSKIYNGKIHYGNPEIILPHYKNQNVHFLDENFFLNDMKVVLPLLKRYNIRWLGMSHFDDVQDVFNEYGEDYLFSCGLRVIEIGLENIVLKQKVTGDGIFGKKVEIFYLNMTFLPNETKESIKQTAEWMKTHNLKNPIYNYNGLWYAPGQFYYPYGQDSSDGILLNSKFARTIPTYIPHSILDQEIELINIDLVNTYSQFIYSKDIQFYPTKKRYKIKDFIGNSYQKAIWVVVGLRVGGII